MAGSMRLVGDPDVWELRVYVGRDSEGRVRHVHRRFRGTREAAALKLRIAMSILEKPFSLGRLARKVRDTLGQTETVQ